jgi:hypothetical protein
LRKTQGLEDTPIFGSTPIIDSVYNTIMRTNVNLDDDIHQLTSAYASARGISLGAAIGELIRRAESPPAQAEIRRAPNGIPLFPRKGRTITNEMVKRALEEDLE